MNLLIYGISQQAKQLYYYIKNETDYVIDAFLVDSKYKTVDEIEGIKVIDFEKINEIFSPKTHQIVLSFGYKNMIRNREEKYNICKGLGYTMFTFISKYSKVFTNNIGEGTLIYPNVTISPNTSIGIGNFITVSTTIAHDTKIGNFNYFSPSSTISGGTNIGNNCFFGISCVVYNNISISDYTLVGAGAVIDKDTSINSAYKAVGTILLPKNSDNYL